MEKDKEYYKKLLEGAIDNDTLLDDDVIAEIEDFLEKEKQRELLQNLKDKEVDEPKDNTKKEEQPQEDTTEVDEPKDNTQEEEQPQEETTQEEEPQEETTQDDNTEGEDDKDKKDKRQSNINIMNKEFRLISAINSIANRNLNEVDSAVVNAGATAMRNAGISTSGQIQLSAEKRTISVSTADGVVETEVENILAPLRDNSVLISAGAKYLTNLNGNVKLPVMNKGNVTWEGETASAKDAGNTITAKELKPKRLTAFVDVSKQFLIQDSADAEATLRADIVNAIGEKLQQTILGTEAGTETKPNGIFSIDASAVTSVTTFKDICDLEAKVDDSNAGANRCYLVSNKAKAGLRNMAKSAKSTELVMQNGEIDGTKVYATSSISDKYLAYGDFSNLVIGQWGGIDLVVDQYSVAKEGCVRLVISAYFDAVVVRPESIAIAKLA
jgi:HK97 family phage major capsid protein